MSDSDKLEVQSLGARGDGIATTTEGARAFIPNGLPGETWLCDGGTYTRVGAPSPDRVEPACRHFDVCGGCVAQHMDDALYRDWKRNLIVDALDRESIETDILPLWSVPTETRRRATFELRRNGAECVIGFHEPKGHNVFDMRMCPVLSPAIVAALPALREIGAIVLPAQGEARVSITQVDNGLAISITAKRLQKLAPERQSEIARTTKSIRAIQLVINGEIFVARQAPHLTIAPATLTIPESTFLQAVPQAEQEMQRIVCDALAKCKSVVDIFCGVGTFAIPLARKSRIAAYDNDVLAVDALASAVRHTQGLKPVTATRRDLFRQPLGARELKGIDGAVINPPRAGAKAQCEQLSKSTLRKLVMVSCNPATFARDARILLDAGYAIGPVQPIDQFLWSPHLEVVVIFTRR